MVTRVGLMGRDEESRVERNAINGIPHSVFPHRLGEAQSSGEKKKGGGENVRKSSPCEKKNSRASSVHLAPIYVTMTEK